MPYSETGRRCLVIVRAGRSSLHQGWLDAPDEARGFDLVVSYFDKEAFDRHIDEPGVFPFYRKGGKWDGIHATLDWLGSALERYDYVWLPDDDIKADGATIEAMFETMRTKNLAVAQPSLTPDSYFTHFLFVNCNGLHLRYSNTVEIMVPCLSAAVLSAVRDHFADTMSGFGLDYIWCRLPETGRKGSAIIDSIQVRHTRPVGNVLAAAMSRHGISPKDEEGRLNARYGIDEPITPLVYALETRDGRMVEGSWRCALAMAVHHIRFMAGGRPDIRNYGFSRIIQLVRRQFTRRLDMAPLTPPSKAA